MQAKTRGRQQAAFDYISGSRKKYKSPRVSVVLATGDDDDDYDVDVTGELDRD